MIPKSISYFLLRTDILSLSNLLCKKKKKTFYREKKLFKVKINKERYISALDKNTL